MRDKHTMIIILFEREGSLNTDIVLYTRASGLMVVLPDGCGGDVVFFFFGGLMCTWAFYFACLPCVCVVWGENVVEA